MATYNEILEGIIDSILTGIDIPEIQDIQLFKDLSEHKLIGQKSAERMKSIYPAERYCVIETDSTDGDAFNKPIENIKKKFKEKFGYVPPIQKGLLKRNDKKEYCLIIPLTLAFTFVK